MASEQIASSTTRNGRVSFIAALVALGCAVLAIVVPAHHQQSTIQWPALPADQSSGTVGAPLLLARHNPEEISVSIPCGTTSRNGTVLKTAVDPVGAGGLEISSLDGLLTMSVGGIPVGSVGDEQLHDASDERCSVLMSFRDGMWRFGDSTEPLKAVEGPPPVVSGLFADAVFVTNAESMVSTTVVAHTSGSTPSALQWILIVSSIGAALVAIVTSCRKPDGAAISAALRHSLGPLDLVVVSAIGVWAIIGPPFLDDGWVMQTVSRRQPGGQFRSYNDTWDASLPLAFIHDAVYWLTVRGTDFLIYWRLVTVLVLIVAWLALRLGLSPVVSRSNRLVWATASAFFILNVGAWLMTLRPEPMVAAASAITLGSALAFERTGRAHWLMLGGVVSAISVSLHPSGLLAAAPMIVLAPCIYRRVRTRTLRATELLVPTAVSCAVLLLCVFADSDVRWWIGNRDVFESSGVHTLGWSDEIGRYVLLFSSVYDTVLRRAAVLVALAVVLLASARRLRHACDATVIPLAALGLAVGFLAATPSKWPWHFGSLAVLATAALAVEMNDYLTSADRQAVSSAFWTTVVAALVSTIAWRGQEFWSVAISGAGRALFLEAAQVLQRPAAPIIIFLLLAVLFRVRKSPIREAVQKAAMVLPLVLILIMVSATYARFAAPAFVDDTSLARTNVAALLGRPTCGLTDAVVIDDPTSSDPLPSSRLDSTTPFETDVPELMQNGNFPIPIGERYWTEDSITTFVNGNDDIGWTATDWQSLPAGDHGLFAGVAGRVGSGNQIVLQRGTVSAGGIENITTEYPEITHDADGWKRVQLARVNATEGELVRIVLVDRTGGFRGWAATTNIWAAPTTPLRSVAEGRVVRVEPFFKSVLPCIDEPPLANGIAVEPDLVLGSIPLGETSSQRFATDLRDLTSVLATENGSPLVSATVLEEKQSWSYLPWRFGG